MASIRLLPFILQIINAFDYRLQFGIGYISNIVKGDRAFMIAGPKVWNSLPSNIRAITYLVDFKKKLKTFFYKKAFM